MKYNDSSFVKYTNDSVNYSVAISVYGLLSDSLKWKDSLKLIYGDKIILREK
jgi:hypothetical protein